MEKTGYKLKKLNHEDVNRQVFQGAITDLDDAIRSMETFLECGGGFSKAKEQVIRMRINHINKLLKSNRK